MGILTCTTISLNMASTPDSMQDSSASDSTAYEADTTTVDQPVTDVKINKSATSVPSTVRPWMKWIDDTKYPSDHMINPIADLFKPEDYADFA